VNCRGQLEGKTLLPGPVPLAALRNPWDDSSLRTTRRQGDGRQKASQAGQKAAGWRKEAVPDEHGSGRHPSDQGRCRVARQDGIIGVGRGCQRVARTTPGRKEIADRSRGTNGLGLGQTMSSGVTEPVESDARIAECSRVISRNPKDAKFCQNRSRPRGLSLGAVLHPATRRSVRDRHPICLQRTSCRNNLRLAVERKMWVSSAKSITLLLLPSNKPTQCHRHQSAGVALAD
jgi:hypothetical protein